MRLSVRLLLGVVTAFTLLTISAAERLGLYQRGTIVRMQLRDCLSDHGFMAALSGNSPPQSGSVCPEYTLVGEKVVYVIVGKASKEVLPLAQEVNFRLRKNDIAIRLDDSSRESRFLVRQMILRGDWERMLQREDISPNRYSLPILRDQ